MIILLLAISRRVLSSQLTLLRRECAKSIAKILILAMGRRKVVVDYRRCEKQIDNVLFPDGILPSLPERLQSLPSSQKDEGNVYG